MTSPFPGTAARAEIYDNVVRWYSILTEEVSRSGDNCCKIRTAKQGDQDRGVVTTLPEGDQPSRRAPTMRDVAALAGVSLKTVSRVVNAEPGVSPRLVDRVVEAVRLLDYRHNLTASSLRRSDQKTASIGLLLEDVSNPFSSALYRAVAEVARQRGTLAFAGSSDEDPVKEAELLRAFVARRVDGLIVVPSGRDGGRLLSERERLGTPTVCVDRPAPFLEVDSVTVDNRAGARLAVRHLAAHGHRRIAFLGDLGTIWTAEERRLGYVQGLAAEGVAYDPALVRQDLSSIDAAQAAVLALLAQPEPPSGLFAGQNLVTIGAIHALRRLGLQHRVALVGFDDFLLADLLDPAVSVVAQDPATLGRSAAEVLFARLDGDRSPPRHLVVPTRLVPRGSGELPAP
jgi:LacI family transcriptional regulator